MTISASGVDNTRSTEGEKFGARTAAWQANSSQTDAGRFSVMILNQYARFPADMILKLFVPNPYTKTISGVVSEQSVLKARTVRCYRRSDGHFVGEAISDAGTGAFSFPGLATGELYFVVAFDDTGVLPNFNALIFDQVQGV